MNGVQLLQQLPGVKIEQLQSREQQVGFKKEQQQTVKTEQFQPREQLPPKPSSSQSRNFRKHEDKVFAQTWQKDILMAFFQKNPYPSKEEQTEIFKATGLGPDWQKCWFHYQRRKLRWKNDGKSTYRPHQQRNFKPYQTENNLKNDENEQETKDKHDAYMLENNAGDILEKADVFDDIKQKFEELNSKYKRVRIPSGNFGLKYFK